MFNLKSLQKHADKMVISCSLLVDMFMGFITWLHLVSCFFHILSNMMHLISNSNRINLTKSNSWNTGLHLVVTSKSILVYLALHPPKFWTRWHLYLTVLNYLLNTAHCAIHLKHCFPVPRCKVKQNYWNW